MKPSPIPDTAHGLETLSVPLPAATSANADVVGAILCIALTAWLLVSSAMSGGSPLGPLAVLAGSAVAFVAGRLIADRRHALAPLVLVAVAGALGLWAFDDIVSDLPLGGPFGYDNATAAFFVQAAVASSMLLLEVRRRWARVAVSIMTAALAAVPFMVGSLAGELLVVAILLVGLLGRLVDVRRLAAGIVVVLGLVLVGTVTLGVTYSQGPPGTLEGVARSVFSERRLALWNDATTLASRDPFFGVGIGRFDEVSDVARADADTRLAHHEFLQVGAEAGVAAGCVLAAIFIWSVLRARTGAADARGRALAAAGAAALGIHACVDFVLHTPLVPFAAAYLMGAATRMNGDTWPNLD